MTALQLVTRAVRVIDLLSTLDIQPAQAKSICDMLFERLEVSMQNMVVLYLYLIQTDGDEDL